MIRASFLSVMILCLSLTACATPAPQMLGSTRHQIALQGIDFVVFHKGDRAQVVRMGYLSRRDRDHVPALMEQAAAATTGCVVIPYSMTTKIPGDTGVADFDLNCG